ncbi:MAG: flippase-like domain-containing protein [Thermoanaerobaculia bacterium]|nr:flippase-like domain-containing protein [Thermoanaerobaculia bacterium]
MRLRRALHAIRILFTLGVLAAGGLYFYRHGAEFQVLTQVKPLDFLAVVAGLALVFLATGLTFYLLVRTIGVDLDLGEWVGLTFVSNALNYLVPIRPGVVAKATYLKRKAGTRYSRFSSVLAAKAVLFVGTTAVLGLLVLVVVRPSSRYASLMAAVCVSLTLAALVPLYVPLYRFRRSGRLFEILNNAVNGFAEIRAQRGRTLWIAASILLQHWVSGLVCIVAYRALDFEISLPIALVVVTFASIANVLAITPNNIGIQELVMAYTYMIAGLDFQQGLLGAALIRAGHVALTFLVSPWFVYWLMSARKLRLVNVLTDDRQLM